jgi:hypothetical protein
MSLEYTDKEIGAIFFLVLGLTSISYLLFKICSKNARQTTEEVLTSNALWKRIAVAGVVIILTGFALWATVLAEWEEQKNKPYGCARDYCWNEQAGEYRGGARIDGGPDCGEYPSCRRAIGMFLGGLGMCFFGATLLCVVLAGLKEKCCFTNPKRMKPPHPHVARPSSTQHVLQPVEANAVEHRLEVHSQQPTARELELQYSAQEPRKPEGGYNSRHVGRSGGISRQSSSKRSTNSFDAVGASRRL